WTPEYKQRVLFNASKAYVSQLDKSRPYELLQPVYSLNLVNDTFSESPDYYHDYRIVEVAETKEVIEGLRFIFIELPKFTPRSYSDRRMQVLWLRYLTEIDGKTREVPEELLSVPEINKAVEEVEESAFTEQELLTYEHFWDMIGASRLLMVGAERRGLEKGMAKGMERGMERGMKQGLAKGLEQGMKQGLEKGMKQGLEKGMKQGLEQGLEQGQQEERIRNARGMKAKGIPVEVISEITGLTTEEVGKL
ncbi:MAG TPA: Rpn family recombination-promoting nuclease/putative transposase, partial [Candidatus Coprenecus stercorigallinarum]|nr:Rpn family recombination-promoting nuclease/putative transposase [Candidatus Coprenecus stercorigallinarum]